MNFVVSEDMSDEASERTHPLCFKPEMSFDGTTCIIEHNIMEGQTAHSEGFTDKAIFSSTSPSGSSEGSLALLAFWTGTGRQPTGCIRLCSSAT